MLKGLPFQQLHGDEGAALEFVNVVDCADVRMIEGGCGASLALKALQGLSVRRNYIGQELEGYHAAKLN
jgi:hypothetical protein